LRIKTSGVLETAAIRCRRQSMKPQVEVNSMNPPPIALCRVRRRKGRLLDDLMYFVQLHQCVFGISFSVVAVVA